MKDQQQAILQQHYLRMSQSEWRAQLTQYERGQAVAKMYSLVLILTSGQSIKSVLPSQNDAKIHQLSMSLEQQIFEKAPSKQYYIQMVGTQIANFQKRGTKAI